MLVESKFKDLFFQNLFQKYLLLNLQFMLPVFKPKGIALAEEETPEN